MRGGEELTFCKNYKITIRIFERKKSEKCKNRAPPPLFCPIPRLRALKRGGSQNGDALK
jgi:hypothetical protein